MFYRASASSNKHLLGELKRYGVLHSARVEAALRRVDRSNFVLHRDQAYVDQPQPIGHGQTISAPHMHVMCLEALEDKLLPGSRVLDVGSGSGYLTAAMGHMVGENGKVIGIEYVDELVELGKQNLRKDSPELLEKGIVEIKKGDGWKGDPDNAPFDAIHVGAGAEELPQKLVEQLKPEGRLIIPVDSKGSWGQDLLQIDKSKDGKSVTKKVLTSCMYVPLVRETTSQL